MTSNELIVNEAHKWLGTPYHHMADVLGYGVDCAMILVRIAIDTGLCPPFDPRVNDAGERVGYPPDWYLHRDEERFLGWVEKFAKRVEGAPIPGDIPLFRFGRCVSHGGILISNFPDAMMIHASQDAGCVERAEIRRWEDRLVGFWRITA